MNIIKEANKTSGFYFEAKTTTTVRFLPLLSIKTSQTFTILTTTKKKIIFIVPKNSKKKENIKLFPFFCFLALVFPPVFHNKTKGKSL
jgi:hypothetical protein